MNAKEFEELTGYSPVDDDLARVNCLTPGSEGHYFCGWCDEHNVPKFSCSCCTAEKPRDFKVLDWSKITTTLGAT